MALPVSCLGCIARRFDWRHLICPPPNESGSALLGSAGPQNERVCAKCVWEYFTLSCFNGLFNADTLVCTIHSWKICNNLRVGGIARFVSFCLLSPIAGRIYDKVGIRIITIIGGSSLVLSNIGMFLFIYTQEFGWRSA